MESNQHKKRHELLEKALGKVRRVVIKTGTSLLADESGINRAMIEKLRDAVLFLRSRGIEVILVSSGAVAMGREILRKKPDYRPLPAPGIARKQALASIGQAGLISLYGEIFAERSLTVGQLLISAEDLGHRPSYLNIGHTLQELLSMGVVPIINENDTVSVEELRLGDNDSLSGAVAALFQAELLIILTSVEGFLVDGHVLPFLNELTPGQLKQAGGPAEQGSGGMRTKIQAARLGQQAGISVAILPGRHENPVQSFFALEQIGSVNVSPGDSSLPARKKWILYSQSKGSVTVDDGAADALIRDGSSLLPAGITEVDGNFYRFDIIDVFSEQGDLIGRGVGSYDAGQLREFLRTRSNDRSYSKEVIHRNDFVLVYE